MARPQAKVVRPATRRAARYIYAFGAGRKDGRADMKDLLGGKGANLAEMARLGLPVPPGFTISTEVCTYYYANRRSYPPALRAQACARLRLGRPLAPLTEARARHGGLGPDEERHRHGTETLA